MKSTQLQPATEWDLVITRVLQAPRELVFRALTDQAHVGAWWGPHGFSNPVCEVDPRPGGALRIDMRGPDGTVYPMHGVFLAIEPPGLIEFRDAVPDDAGSNLFEVMHRISLEALGPGRTRLTLLARVVARTPAADPYIQGMDEGWKQSIDRLETHLARPGRECLCIRREYDAPCELVFAAWTRREHLLRWLCPTGFSVLFCEVDPRPGGRWRSGMRDANGEYIHHGIYHEVNPPHRLVFTHSWEQNHLEPRADTVITIDFVDLGGGRTAMTFRQAGLATPESRDSHGGGWTGAFENLAAVLSIPAAGTFPGGGM